MTTQPTSLSYKDAGVDIDAGEALVQRIKSVAKATSRSEVVGGLGGFGALCRIPQGYKSPLLVSGTDGVGTKLKLALQLQQHDTIGQDLVAMCVNDLLVCGAEPLFFLDYYATGKLDVDTAATVISVSVTAVNWQIARSSVARRLKCRVCIKMTTMIWQVFVWASSKSRKLSRVKTLPTVMC